MATAQPPLYYFNGIAYNDAFFNSAFNQTYADSQYLARTGNATTSNALNTTFPGLVTATTNANSIISKAQIAHTISTTGVTDETVFTIPFVPANVTATSQTLLVDSGAGVNHLNYTPSTNTLSVGSTTNGNINVLGTASQITINGTGTALNIPNGTVTLNRGAGTALSIPDGTVTLGTGFLNVSVNTLKNNSPSDLTDNFNKLSIGSGVKSSVRKAIKPLKYKF